MIFKRSQQEREKKEARKLKSHIEKVRKSVMKRWPLNSDLQEQKPDAKPKRSSMPALQEKNI
jgi:ribosomal 50S subunit-associated protein YjgA (DUF615 family)